jgi:hypothetical protein
MVPVLIAFVAMVWLGKKARDYNKQLEKLDITNSLSICARFKALLRRASKRAYTQTEGQRQE